MPRWLETGNRGADVSWKGTNFLIGFSAGGGVSGVLNTSVDDQSLVTSLLVARARQKYVVIGELAAVGRITIRLVPKAILMATSAGSPISVKTMYCTGVMMKAPPRPRRPPAKPTPTPVTSRMMICVDVTGLLSPPCLSR